MSKIQLTYIGRVEGNNYLIHKYIADTGVDVCFKSKIGKFDIGTIIEVEETETGIKGPYTKVGFHQNISDLTKWKNRDEAVYYEEQLNNKLKKVLDDETANAIRILRKNYRDLYGVQKQNFINRVIHEICKY